MTQLMPLHSKALQTQHFSKETCACEHPHSQGLTVETWQECLETTRTALHPGVLYRLYSQARRPQQAETGLFRISGGP